jgi:hypothetical protein
MKKQQRLAAIWSLARSRRAAQYITRQIVPDAPAASGGRARLLSSDHVFAAPNAHQTESASF